MSRRRISRRLTMGGVKVETSGTGDQRASVPGEAIGLGLQVCRAHAVTSNPSLAGRRQLYVTRARFSRHEAAAPDKIPRGQ